MENKMFCPKCDKTQPVKTIRRQETLPVRDANISVLSEVTVCSVCKEEFATTAQEEENVLKAYGEYRKQKGLLTHSEVRDVRVQYGLSQTAFSRWLGWGDITIHRYESGSLQDAVHNEALLLLRDPRNAEKLLETNRDNLDEASAQRLERAVAARLSAEVVRLVEEDLAAALSLVAPSEFNGYRRYNAERFEHLVLHVLEKTGPAYKTAVNKYLWYIDFCYYRDQASSITGTQYLKFPHGPIPKSYEMLFAAMIEKGSLGIEEVSGKDFSGERYAPKVRANTDLFQGDELQMIDGCLAALAEKGKTARQLSDMAHNEAAYMLTKDREPISYRHAKDLKLKLSSAKTRKTEGPHS
jgi:putative zinc finger/helix-turn-helix YgiT family protein